MKPYEQYLKNTIFPQLEQGRPGWDKPHAEEVVRYVKEISRYYNSPEIHDDVLVVVAYLHDYGYIFFKDMLKPGPTSGIPKQQHAAKSVEQWIEIQDNPVFEFFSKQQKERIEHLIRVHDEIETLTDIDELVFMEADTLGALSMGNFQNINSEVYDRYLQSTHNNRVSRFITDYSKKEAARLLD